MRISDQLIVSVCRNSWRVYGHANFVFEIDGLNIPLVGHIGLDNLQYRDDQFRSLIGAALTTSPDGHILDIGANIGRFLLNLLQVDSTRP